MNGFKDDNVLTNWNIYVQWFFTEVVRAKPPSVVIKRHVANRHNNLPAGAAVDLKTGIISVESLDVTKAEVAFLYRI